MGAMQTPTLVKDNPLFRNMTELQIDKVMEKAQEKTFVGGDTIVRQFDKNSELIIVIRGICMVRTFSGETVAEVGPGTVLGEVSMVDSEPRSATVIAKGEVLAAVINADDMRTLLEGDIVLKAQFMENIARVLATRLRAANVHMDFAGR